MKLQRGTDGALYVFPEVGLRAPANALAGPFADLAAALWWQVEALEAKLTPPMKAIWTIASARILRFQDRYPDPHDGLGRGAAGLPAHSLTVLGLLLHGASERFVLASAGPVW